MAQAADGAPIGRSLFKDRLAIVVLCDPIRALLGDKAFGLSLKVAFDTMLPTKHPYNAVFSKPRSVGRRRGRPTSSSSRPTSGIQTHLLAPTMDCIRAFPESLQCPKAAQFLFGRAADVAGLAEAVERFTDARWRHLGVEERPILPAARCALTEEAFRQDGVFRVGGKRDEAFGPMFARRMNMASEDKGR